MTGSMTPLAGQQALVTGGNTGIGKAIAVALAGAGARVAINYVTQADAAHALVEAIAADGGEAMAVEADVTDEQAVIDMFAHTVERFGALDILVNNAGVQRDGATGEMTREQWDTVIAVNLTGQFLCAREAVRIFARQGRRTRVSRAAGKIVCISSVHQRIPWAGHINYAASKGGVDMLVRSLAQEVAPAGVRVNGIAPGAVKTEINRSAWESPQARRELLALIPYNRIGEPEDVARAAVWLASDDSDYVVGTTLFIDGGMTLYPGFTHGG